MNELLLKTIDNLPPLPETIMKLQQYIDSSGSSVQVQGVVDIISKDPLLTGDLLRLANSPYYGFSREISTLNQVVSLLGINNVKILPLQTHCAMVLRLMYHPMAWIQRNFWGIAVGKLISYQNGLLKMTRNFRRF